MTVDIFKPELRNKDQWCPRDVQNWFNYITSVGWLPIYEAASQESGEKLSVLMAQGTKEGGLGFYRQHPDGKVIGDHGVAFGLHQLHAFGGQTAEDLLPPEKNIPEAAKRLVANRRGVRRYATLHNLTMSRELETQLVLDAYNRGLTGELRAYERDPEHPDALTAGGNYASDILARAVVVDQLLEAYRKESSSATDCQ